MIWYGFMVGVIASITTIVFVHLMEYIVYIKDGSRFGDIMFKVISPYNVDYKKYIEDVRKEEQDNDE